MRRVGAIFCSGSWRTAQPQSPISNCGWVHAQNALFQFSVFTDVPRKGNAGSVAALLEKNFKDSQGDAARRLEEVRAYTHSDCTHNDAVDSQEQRRHAEEQEELEAKIASMEAMLQSTTANMAHMSALTDDLQREVPPF